MNAPDPPDDRNRPGMRQTMRSSFQKAKDAVKRRPNPQQLSGQSEDPTTLSPRSMLRSVFGRSTSSLIAGRRDSESDRAWSRLTRSLRTLESSVELFPPLRSAVGALIGCMDIVQAAASNREDYAKLVTELESMANVLAQDASELASEPSKGSVANIAKCIEQQVANIKQKAEHGAVRRHLNATQDQEDVMQQYRQIESLFRQLQCDLTMRTKDITKKHYENNLLKGMSPVDDARYNSGYSTTVRRRGCTAETREGIHQTLQEWTTDPEREKIYWMNGMAGTGKTTIAYSFCEWLEDTNRLGGSFYCSRISSSCRSLNQIVPTIAYQLAHFSPAFRTKLCTALNDNPDAGKLNVMQQFEKLINKPMLDSKDAIPDGVVVVIDALDECDDSFSVRLLLDVLLKFADELPLKFFVASRPEHAIRDRMVSQGGAARAIVHLHDIEQSIVEEDIKKYLTEALSFMFPSPSMGQISALAKRSRNLFIYAATVVRFIHPEDFPVDSAERLELMLKATSDPRAMSMNKYEVLDKLYTTVLSAVFHPLMGDHEKARIQQVLRAVVCAKEPISVGTIASFASLDENQVWAALKSLRSVIHVPENNGLISALHASFPEYMLDECRSKGFYCNESESNERLVHRLFDIMKSELQFNICDLTSSYLNDDQVEDLEDRVTQHISPTLSYSCRYWSDHLSLSPTTANTRDMLLDFLLNRLLFWMEVLSLCRSIGIGAPMIQEAQTWLRRLADKPDDIQKQLSDARNFVTWFAANPCSRSTPHIYISALPLCAKSNWMYQHYSKRMRGVAHVKISQLDEALLAIWSTDTTVDSLAISPDGSRIVAGAGDGSIMVFDIHTGVVVLGPLNAHTSMVPTVKFSPDGALIASGSTDFSVIIWDAYTGRVVTGPLRGTTDAVWSVAFSPDGTRLVSGSADCAVRAWDISTGAVVLGPLGGHSERICALAYSPDGRLIASGSDDFTIRLWDAFTGTALAEPLHRHRKEIWMVAYSPDGTTLASCSEDSTIQLWDITTRTAVGQPMEGHTGPVNSLAFSADGAKIVSGGGNDSIAIIVWDTHTKSTVLGPLHGHIAKIWSVVFSSDGTRVISGSQDRTIRIWDVQGANRPTSTQQSRETSVGPVAFSPDRTQFISCSSSGALHTWDMRTGTIIPPTLEASQVLGTITSVAYSPDGQHVAAGASDLAIYVWSILSGTIISQPLTGHTASIRCLAFSPDGASICSGSDDSTIIVWNIRSGAMIGQSYQGHTGSVHSITYSPDGTRIASGGADHTVQVWDPATGKLVHTLSGHEGSVDSVGFSPDGSYIISGSADGYIRKWDLAGKCATNKHAAFFDRFGTSAPSEVVKYNCGDPVSCVAFSPDGTRVIVGYAHKIRILNPQITESLTKLSSPRDERVRWVGFSPEGNDIISVSTSTKEDTHQPTDDTSQQPSQRPNIIRVWRAGSSLDQASFSSKTGYWSHERDGRILSPEGLVAWVSPDLLPHLGRSSRSSTYYNPFVLSSKGVIDLGYKGLCVGERWTECYAHKG